MAYASDPSERLAQLRAEGRMGPQFGQLGGRPRTVRASELAADAASEHATELIAALRAPLSPNEPAERRSRGAERWLRLALREGELAHREMTDLSPDPYVDAPRDELLDLLIPLLTDMSETGELPDPRRDAIESSAVELTD